MEVGLLADTHDNLDAIRYFVDWFGDQSVEVILHAGDFVSPFTIPELASFDGEVYGVFGNNDGDKEALLDLADDTPVTIEEAPRPINLDGRTFIMSHKPDDLPKDSSDEVDVFIHGHTHVRELEQNQASLTINPGEAGGWLSSSCSAAVINTSNLEVRTQVVPRP